MKKTTLDIEQMKHLQGLGLDTSDASAYWYRIVQHKSNGVSACIRVISDWKRAFSLNVACCTGHTIESISAFTLDDVMELLPKEINCYSLTITSIGGKWYISYTCNNRPMQVIVKAYLIDAAYEMLCWVIENGYLKVE